MATTVNFASISGVISVTSGSNPPKYFYGAVGQFCQTPDATGYLIFIGGTSFTVSLSELRINGQAPLVSKSLFFRVKQHETKYSHKKQNPMLIKIKKADELTVDNKKN